MVTRWFVGLVVLVMLLTSPARAGTANAADRLVDLANASRDSAGLPEYRVVADLNHVARQQAARMATAHRIFHNPNLTTEVPDWFMVGENVGVGQSPQQIHTAFMASPIHRADILSADFAEIGVGFAVGTDRRLYVSEVFRLREPHAAPAALPIVAPQLQLDAVPAPAAPTTTAPTTAPEVTPTTPTPAAIDTRAAIAASSPAQPQPQWGGRAASLFAAALAFGVLSAHVALLRSTARR